MKKIITGVLLGTIMVLGLFVSGIMAQEYHQSPVLTERVEKGELPPVSQRLPATPLEVGPGVLLPEDSIDWQVGTYGGTLRTGTLIPEIDSHYFVMMNEALLGAPGINTEGVRGNVVRDFSISDDNRVYTFHMRKGLRWSDGVPVTTEDVRFTYEDVFMNEKINPVFPERYRGPSGEPMDLEIIDDYTFKIKFQEPYGGFVRELTYMGWVSYSELIKPKHYLKDFHIKYTPLADMKTYLDEEELDDEWWELFNIKDVQHIELTSSEAIGFPVLYPWIRVEGPSEMMVFERNPYYYKVDIEGNQLPYIDRLESVYVTDMDMLQMKVITGELPYLGTNYTSLQKMPLYRENEDRGNYRAKLLGKHNTPTVLFLNYTYDDPVWKEVTGDPRFRRALAYSIDSQEIIDNVFLGLAELPQTTPGEYKPEAARQLLDEMGLGQLDEAGYRLGPDGDTFELFIEVSENSPYVVPVTELLVEYFQDVGIKTSMKIISNELRGQRIGANQIMATVNWTPEPQWRRGLKKDYLPGGPWCAQSGPQWGLWFNSDGESGVEPPADVQKIYELHQQRQQYPPFSPQDKEAMDEIYSLFYENVYYIFTVGRTMDPIIVPNNLMNVPHDGWTLEGTEAGVQYYFAD